MSEKSAGPLAGITVLELGVFIAGPYATMQLADMGARVIKIEPPAGDPMRASGPFLDGHSSPFIRLNRNKESVVLDLKSEEGRTRMHSLLEHADVLVENMRPGALAKMGFGYTEIAEEFPKLIYASASGWGQDGPLAPLAGLDIMAQARSGLMSITGFPDQPPAKVGVPISDLTTALYVALGIVSALHERTRSGRGQYLDVSLFESAVSLAVWEAGSYFGAGTVSRPNGSAHQAQAPYQAVTVSDGYVTIGANTSATWTKFCSAFDFADLEEHPRYATPALRFENREALIAVIEDRLRARTIAEVVDELNRVGVPAAPINDYGQVFTDEHLSSRGYFWSAPHPDLGEVTQLGNPMRFSRSAVRHGNAGPALGADTERVLAEFTSNREDES
ncbi:formyl-CoA transferase [Brevibacterium sanguinis]|uniref:Formyl-CoA transferase n=2 Tax=Brevibacterium TaxID=1696 RepID=A0A366IIR8_9MICO|nr:MULTISPECIES: CoA transferase [Brevibacterium]RBP62027.1 formyl-CoA transferase [Brevibacterium sanguinis]RBP70551.1 formyl-CoA transferase [Brevibacterium celere]